MRAVLRFVASVMMVSGALLIADAGATLLWQEPVSAFVAEPRAGPAEEGVLRPAPPRGHPAHAAQGRRDRAESRSRRSACPSTSSRAPTPTACARAPATTPRRRCPASPAPPPSPATAPPTAPRSGTSTSSSAASGSIIDMPDGRFVYRVEQTKIVDDQDLSVLDRVGYQRLVLSACHPLYSAAQRVIVFARLAERELRGSGRDDGTRRTRRRTGRATRRRGSARRPARARWRGPPASR